MLLEEKIMKGVGYYLNRKENKYIRKDVIIINREIYAIILIYDTCVRGVKYENRTKVYHHHGIQGLSIPYQRYFLNSVKIRDPSVTKR